MVIRGRDAHMTLDEALIGFAELDAAELGQPWTWRDGKMDVRHALYRTLEDAQELLVPAAAAPLPESGRILALAQRAFGDLRGLLIGLPAEHFDRGPAEGEWSIRQVLRHMIVIERRYEMQTRYAVERADDDPMRIAADRLAEAEEVDDRGDAAALLSRLGAARAETHRSLGDLPPAAMTRPTQWIHYQIDVRFRLHRFAAHVVEHTVQCEKTLAALAWPETEGRRVVRQIWSLVGELEGLGAAKELAALAAAVEERRGSVKA
jgi:uncharacterized damage-inducible protein DinB